MIALDNISDFFECVDFLEAEKGGSPQYKSQAFPFISELSNDTQERCLRLQITSSSCPKK
jgi:hypothetical protein